MQSDPSSQDVPIRSVALKNGLTLHKQFRDRDEG
jgi:hypothetical protein